MRSPITALTACLLACAAGAHPGLHPQLTALTEEIHRSPEQASLYLSRSRLYLVHGAPDWALHDAEMAKCLDPDWAAPDLARARALSAAGWSRTSLAVLDAYLFEVPDDAAAFVLRSDVLLDLMHPRRAAEDYERAIELTERPSPGQLLRRAQLRAALGSKDAARAFDTLEQASVAMGRPTVLESYAIRLERQLSRFDAALARAERVASTQRRQEPWVLLRAEILEEAGRTADAARLYKELATTMRSSPPRWTRAAIEAVITEADAGAARCDAELARAADVMEPNDRPTLSTLGDLASLRMKQGRREEARELFSRLLERQREAWDDDHPLALTTQSNLAGLLTELGVYDEAEPIARDLVERRARVLGPSHRSTILSMSNLARILKATDRPEEAERFYRDGLRLARESLGAEHEVTVTLMVDLGDLYGRDGRFEEALELQTEARERLIGSIGLKHPNAALLSLTVSNTLLDLERWEDAEASVRDAIHLADNVLPADSWRHASFKATLGKALMGQARYAEAAPLMTRAHEAFTVAFGPDSAQAVDLAQSLADLFERAGEAAVAETWRARAVE